MKQIYYCLLLCIGSYNLFAQHKDTTAFLNDTLSLQNVTVTAFASDAKWKDVPASIAVLSNSDLHRFDGTASIVSAMNTVSGVRMEERSPGSYRISVRGSLLRSPFGVRNVKIYWDDIPLTDASGNTYINLVDLNDVHSAEIIKGPSSSIYGANTGGAILLQSGKQKFNTRSSLNATLAGGSYGLFNEQAGWQEESKNFFSNLQQSHVQCDGYRIQSALRKDVIKWNGQADINSKQQLSFLAFYADLHYETPGGLTQRQFDSASKQARAGTAALQTGVYNKTFFGGLSLKSSIGKNFGNKTSAVINHTDYKNPFLTNYEKRNEWNYGVRTAFSYSLQKKQFRLQGLAGAELQYNTTHDDNYGNKAGVADTVQFKDLLHVTQYFAFAQLNMTIGAKLFLQAGISRNETHYWYDRTTDLLLPYPQTKIAGPVAAPRFSALYHINNRVSVYGIVAKGFSPPTIAEIRPSDGNYYGDLEPEFGWNYEAGIKGSLAKNKVDFNASFYYFNLKDAIVRRVASSGAEYFINAGSTVQKGVEVWFKAHLVNNGAKFISLLAIWNSFSYQPYHFNQYIIDTADYSGNRLTGVPQTINASGVDINLQQGYYTNIIFNCISSLPLNDANTADSKAYQLLQIQLGKRISIRHSVLNVFAGIDNLLNQRYSLGNDINAFGGRYFNAAPARNFYAGLKFSL